MTLPRELGSTTPATCDECAQEAGHEGEHTPSQQREMAAAVIARELGS